MQRERFIQFTAVALVALVSLTGCKHPPAPKSGSGSGAGSGTGNLTGIQPLDGGGGVGMDGSSRPSGDWGQRGEFEPVFFDFDSSRIRPSEVTKLETVAAALRGNTKKLVVEGHADERGTAEYNRALGERRALACREELIKQGVPADRITTISYGEDRPAELGHDEAAWARNRRCEFITVSH